MADVDVDPFGEHGKTDETADETFPLTPRGGSTWEPEHEQETSFEGESHESETFKEKVKELYQLLGITSKNIKTSKTGTLFGPVRTW